jgi:adenylate kinase
MNLIILGPQASGKGTQADLLTKELGLFHLESGELLRELAKTNKKIYEYQNVKGELVPDEETLGYIAKHLDEKDAFNKGVIFDGYPRSVRQYNLLKDWLNSKKQKINKAIFVNVSEDTTVERLSARRVCEKCKTVYNLITNPPPLPSRCECGGGLVQRDDDRPETIRKRLKVYKELTKPLIDVLRKEGNVIEVNGERDIDVIFTDILKKLEDKGENNG